MPLAPPPSPAARLRLRRLLPPLAVPLFFAVLLVAFAVGIWGSYRAQYPGPGLYRVTGVFDSRSGDTMILVRHEAVPGLMEKMASMAFFAESKELLDRAALKPGDHVRFTIRQMPDTLLVVEIQKIQ